MKALIFAAGLGQRMRPLTDHTPKPLLHAGGKRLIEWHLEKLAAAGIDEVVINIAYLAEQFPAALGDGSRHGVRITYSREGRTPLGTGGGMLKASPLLGNQPFLALNADIFTDIDFSALPHEPRGVAELVLVPNPPQHAQGDFGINAGGTLLPHIDSSGIERTLTFAGIGVYRSRILDGWRAVLGDTPETLVTPPRFSITPLLRAAIERGEVGWQEYHGFWTDVGTPQRLQEPNLYLNRSM